MRTIKAPLVALLGLALLAALVAVAAPHGSGGGPIYTVAQARAGLTRQPRAWVGRTVLVRGQLIVAGCAGSCFGDAVLADTDDASKRLRVTWTTVNPMLTLLLGTPIVGPLVKGRIGGVGVYRVRLARQTFASSPSDLPRYFPYTNRRVYVTDDSGVLVDGLK